MRALHRQTGRVFNLIRRRADAVVFLNPQHIRPRPIIRDGLHVLFGVRLPPSIAGRFFFRAENLAACQAFRNGVLEVVDVRTGRQKNRLPRPLRAPDPAATRVD